MKSAKNSAHHYTACGLDYVHLQNGFTCAETDYGPAVAVEDINGLHRAIVFDIIRQRAYLQGKEIRFLRTELDMTQNRLAFLLGVDHQTVARWEKGQSAISGPADRLLRLLCAEHAYGGDKSEKVTDFLRALAETDHPVREARRFEKTPEGWRIAA